MINPEEHQSLYFSYIDYEGFVPLPGFEDIKMPKSINTIVMFCGIANSYPLQEYLRDFCIELLVIDFPDHHVYSKKDIQLIAQTFNDVFSRNKILVTTEKDAMRLIKSEYIRDLNDLPVFYVPIKVKLHGLDQSNFSSQIKKYVKENKRNS
jgi:tetraacyldisaccharide 4'-kinase